MLSDSERRLLNLLQREGRLPNVEIAKRVGLSESPCLRRIKQLEASGVIKGYSAVIDRKKVGFDVVALIQVNLDQRTETVTKTFLDAVKNEPQIIECYAVSGSYDYFIKAVVHSIDEFSDLAMKRILKFPGVRDITSAFVLEDLKDSEPLPV